MFWRKYRRKLFAILTKNKTILHIHTNFKMPFVFLAVCGAHFFGVPKYFLISPHLPNLDAIYIDYLIQNTYLPTIRNQHL
jgi:hypothetical protein